MVRVPGIRGGWEVVDSQREYSLLRSVEYGSYVPMLVVDSEMNLVKETRGSLRSAMGWDKGSRRSRYLSMGVQDMKDVRRETFTSDGYKIVRDEEVSSIPMKSSGKGYYHRRGYQYAVYRPDGSRIQTKAMSMEDARRIASRGRESR